MWQPFRGLPLCNPRGAQQARFAVLLPGISERGESTPVIFSRL